MVTTRDAAAGTSPLKVAEHYAAALLDTARSPADANRILESALRDGDLDARTIDLEVIPAALEIVGRRWADGDVSVADEHLATEAVRDAIRMVAEHLGRPARRRGSIVVAAVDGELHALGSRILADLLEADGWEVLYVGASTPPDALAVLVAERRPSAVALSATLASHLPALAESVRRLRAPGLPRVFVVVGGQACASEDGLAERIGADACEAGADRAVAVLAAARLG